MLLVQKKNKSIIFYTKKDPLKNQMRLLKKVGCVFLGKQPTSSNETRGGQPLAFLVHTH